MLEGTEGVPGLNEIRVAIVQAAHVLQLQVCCGEILERGTYWSPLLVSVLSCCSFALASGGSDKNPLKDASELVLARAYQPAL